MKPVLLYRLLSPLSYETIIALLAKLKDRVGRKNIVRFLAEFHMIKVLIDGDIIREFGIEEGPQVKKILKRIHNARINKKIFSKEEELEFLKKIIKVK